MNFFKQIASGFNKPEVDFSKFDMSHEHKTTMRFGELVPVFMEEVLPGDKWHISPNAFVRTMPLLSPMMHKVDLKMRFFFVPNRLIWDKWEPFISSGEYNGRELFIPTIKFTGNNDQYRRFFRKGSLFNYFGLAVRDEGLKDVTISQMPFRAYDLVWSEYFCNQSIDPQVVRNVYDGPKFYTQNWGDTVVVDKPANATAQNLGQNFNILNDMLMPQNVLFEPDYFTSCLPTPMGMADSLNGSIRVQGGSVTIGGHKAVEDSLYPSRNGASDNGFRTVSELRNAFRLQSFLENSLRTGKRYVEQLFAHFGVDSSDSRIQRPEYLGGGRLAIQISEVAATTESENLQLGDLAGRGISVGSFGDIDFTSEEHGYIIGLAYIVPHTSYFGGIPKTFLRSQRLDYAFPEFATLGEQPVFNCEVDASYTTDSKENKIFGYVPRYSEYKQSLDKFSGGMVSDLAFWHLGRNFFESKPTLSHDFVYITDNARQSLNRVFGVTDPKAHPFVCSFGFSASAIRPLPYNPQSVF